MKGKVHAASWKYSRVRPSIVGTMLPQDGSLPADDIEIPCSMNQLADIVSAVDFVVITFYAGRIVIASFPHTIAVSISFLGSV